MAYFLEKHCVSSHYITNNISMNKSKKFIGAAVLMVLMTACGNGSKFKYETVPNDPMQTRIYTLDNGLKVYLTVNKETDVQGYREIRYYGLQQGKTYAGRNRTPVRGLQKDYRRS